MLYTVGISFTGYKVIEIEAEKPSDAYMKALKSERLYEIPIEDFERLDRADYVLDKDGEEQWF
jgi:hypothetical protein